MLRNYINFVYRIILQLSFIITLAGCFGGGGDSTATPVVDTTPPSIPVNLAANVVSSTEIDLIWDASTDNIAVAGYTVYRDGVSLTDVTAVGYNDIALNPETEYCYTVSSFDAAANASAQSIQACVTTLLGPDTTPPVISLTFPLSGAVDVDYDAVISASFSEDMQSSSINSTTFIVTDSKAALIDGSVTYDEVSKKATYTPDDQLAYAETYTAKILTAVKDLAGNLMLSDVSWSFTTKVPLVSFATGGAFAIGSSVTDIVTVDFNHDNKRDLAITDWQSDSVSVLLGDGAGAFGTRTDYAAGDGPRAITYGYFDADANIDLAVANETYVLPLPLPSGTVSVFLGDGAGSFDAATSYDVGDRPMDIAAGDFDGDIIIDLVTANNFSDNVSVITGTGTGSFFPATNYDAGFSPRSIVAEDYNKDQILDLVITNSSDASLSVLLGTNTGSFATATSYAAGSYPIDIATGDLNQDGNQDVVVANDGTGNVTVLAGDGTGAFGTGVPVAVGQFPRTVTVADVNNDAIPDLVVSTSFNGGFGTNSVFVILGYGSGSFGTAIPVYSVSSAFINPPIMVVGDFNGDNKLDIAVTDPVTSKVHILINTTM